jgi:hypothetical protein
MTPRPTERAARLVTAWVRCYTRHLPAAVAERRIGEISADLHDHIAHEQARGTSDRRIAMSVLSRMVRGLAADASWRGRIRPWRRDLMKSFAGILAAALAIAAAGVLLTVYSAADDDAPGGALIGILLIAGALAIAVRTARRRWKRRRGRQGADHP